MMAALRGLNVNECLGAVKSMQRLELLKQAVAQLTSGGK